MKKLMLAAAAICAVTAFAETESAVTSAIVGYGYYDVPINYSIWSPIFKSIGTKKIHLADIKPCTPNNVVLTGDGKITIFKLSTEGVYGTLYKWCPAACGGWSADNGATKIADDSVSFEPGEGFAMINSLKVNGSGVESTARGSVASKARLLVSGEVDLDCKNVAPPNYSISGNSTPKTIYLSQITPQTPSFKDLTGDGKVTIFKLSTEGVYGTLYKWCPAACGGWSADNGATKIADDSVSFAPGEGFAMINSLKVNGSGVESTARGSVASPVVLAIPSPL